ncbi:MAG: Rpn family recombination-promoting nuclease/putative transposase, partial [Rhodospirillaceae bacterium]
QFFQRMLDKPGNAGALLRERLPAEVVRLLVNEPPELIPGSFVSPRLRAYRTDRLFRTSTIVTMVIYNGIEEWTAPLSMAEGTGVD